jgi:hypothetical protein
MLIGVLHDYPHYLMANEGTVSSHKPQSSTSKSLPTDILLSSFRFIRRFTISAAEMASLNNLRICQEQKQDKLRGETTFDSTSVLSSSVYFYSSCNVLHISLFPMLVEKKSGEE